MLYLSYFLLDKNYTINLSDDRLSDESSGGVQDEHGVHLSWIRRVISRGFPPHVHHVHIN